MSASRIPAALQPVDALFQCSEGGLPYEHTCLLEEGMTFRYIGAASLRLHSAVQPVDVSKSEFRVAASNVVTISQKAV